MLCSQNGDVPADNGTEPPPCAPVMISSGSEAESEEFDMSGITNLEIENGILYMYFGPCCRIAVGSIGTLSPGEDLSIPWEDYDPDFQYSACARATAVVEAIYAVADAIFNEIDVATFWTWPHDVEVASGVGDLKDKYITEGVLAGAAYLVGASVDPIGLPVEESDIFNLVTKAEILCKLAAVFGAHGEVMTSSERSAIDSIFKSNMSLQVTFFESAWRAIGDAKLSQIAQSASTQTDVECDCPQAQIDYQIPVAYTWSHLYDFTIDDYDFTSENGESEYTPGVGWTVVGGDSASKAGGWITKVVGASGGTWNYGMYWQSFPTDYVGGGAGPHFFEYDSTNLWYDAAYIKVSPLARVLNQALSAGHEIRFNKFQNTAGGVQEGYVLTKILITGTGTDPFPGDPGL